MPKSEPIVRVVTLELLERLRQARPLPATKKSSFGDLPCKHRGEVALKKVAICATCEKEIELATCSYYATICTVKGSAINGTKSASCADCPQRSQ